MKRRQDPGTLFGRSDSSPVLPSPNGKSTPTRHGFGVVNGHGINRITRSVDPSDLRGEVSVYLTPNPSPRPLNGLQWGSYSLPHRGKGQEDRVTGTTSPSLPTPTKTKDRSRSPSETVGSPGGPPPTRPTHTRVRRHPEKVPSPLGRLLTHPTTPARPDDPPHRADRGRDTHTTGPEGAAGGPVGRWRDDREGQQSSEGKRQSSSSLHPPPRLSHRTPVLLSSTERVAHGRAGSRPTKVQWSKLGTSNHHCRISLSTPLVPHRSTSQYGVH